MASAQELARASGPTSCLFQWLGDGVCGGVDAGVEDGVGSGVTDVTVSLGVGFATGLKLPLVFEHIGVIERVIARHILQVLVAAIVGAKRAHVPLILVDQDVAMRSQRAALDVSLEASS